MDVSHSAAKASCLSGEIEFKYARRASIPRTLPRGNILSIPQGHLPLGGRPYSGRMDDALREFRRTRFLEILRERKAVDLVEVLGVPADYISRVKTGRKGIGEQYARAWEKALGKPEFWFDKPDNLVPMVAEDRALYHGILLTRAGALLAAEWEKLDVADRIEIEETIRQRVRDNIRDKRRPEPGKGAQRP